MNATRRGWVWFSMATGAALLAGCAEAPMAAKSPMAGEPIATPSYAPASAAPREPAAPAQPQAMSRDEGDYRHADKMEEAPRKDRPGLGTEWGETRYSSISHVGFERADWSSPIASLALFYNDQEGANAMASAHRSWASTFSLVGGMVTVDLRDEGGSPYRGFVAGGRSYVIGEAGHRYSIVLHNRTDLRMEVVLSVDGLDVMDGKRASFEKRGYILDPRSDLEVDGFRQSTDTVAAFRFGSVHDSYAEQKHGDARNVGVIGVALFQERGAPLPAWTTAEVQRRRSANPFPGTFATPPGE